MIIERDEITLEEKAIDIHCPICQEIVEVTIYTLRRSMYCKHCGYLNSVNLDNFKGV